MNKINGISCLVMAVLMAPSAGMSQQAVRWESSIEGAKRVAGQTGRLVLIEFGGARCPFCRRLEAEALSQPAIAAAINADCVAVKINADDFPATARQYGIANLPTHILMSPQGQVVASKEGYKGAEDYAAWLRQTIGEAKRRNAAAYAQIPPSAGLPPASAVQNAPPRDYAQNPPATSPPTTNLSQGSPATNPPATYQPPAVYQPAAVASAGQPPYGSGGYNGYNNGYNPPAGNGYNPPAANSASATAPTRGVPGPVYGNQASQASATQPLTGVAPSRALDGSQRADVPGVVAQPPIGTSPSVVVPQPPAGVPTLGLDGYCPVTLLEKQKWVQGDRRWGVNHRGRIYLFAGPDEQRRFWSDPDRYSPVASGNDVVLAVEQGRPVPGSRKYGAFFENRVYLFSSEASLAKFSDPKNTKIYAAGASEILRAGVSQSGPQWR
jgi:hypothetical protein